MASRKTFDVAELLYMVNHRNKYSTCEAAVRDGWNYILMEVLLATGNYKGYSYLYSHEIPAGHLPGIRDNGAGVENMTVEERFHNVDETRRIYHVPDNLREAYTKLALKNLARNMELDREMQRGHERPEEAEREVEQSIAP